MSRIKSELSSSLFLYFLNSFKVFIVFLIILEMAKKSFAQPTDEVKLAHPQFSLDDPSSIYATSNTNNFTFFTQKQKNICSNIMSSYNRPDMKLGGKKGQIVPAVCIAEDSSKTDCQQQKKKLSNFTVNHDPIDSQRPKANSFIDATMKLFMSELDKSGGYEGFIGKADCGFAEFYIKKTTHDCTNLCSCKSSFARRSLLLQ